MNKFFNVNCPKCDQHFEAPGEMHLSTISCTTCGESYQLIDPSIPRANAVPPPIPSSVSTSKSAKPSSGRNVMIIASAIAVGCVIIAIAVISKSPSSPTTTQNEGITPLHQAPEHIDQRSNQNTPPNDGITASELAEAEARSSLWTVQLTQIANKKAECENTIQQQQFDLNRYTAARDSLKREKELKIQEMNQAIVKGGANSDSLLEAFGVGLLGGAGNAMIAEDYDKRISKISLDITTINNNIDAWKAEQQRLRDWEIECISWPKYRGHVYPVVLELDAGGVADQSGLDIQKGDQYISYNGHTLAYASPSVFTAPREEADRLNISKVEIVFARGVKFIRHKVDGGKLIGVLVSMPIRE